MTNNQCLFFFIVAQTIGAQELNDPAKSYVEGRLGNRKIWWCPSGYGQLLAVIMVTLSLHLWCSLYFVTGYLSFCPQPTDWDSHIWCCTWPYMGNWKPGCCPFMVNMLLKVVTCGCQTDRHRMLCFRFQLELSLQRLSQGWWSQPYWSLCHAGVVSFVRFTRNFTNIEQWIRDTISWIFLLMLVCVLLRYPYNWLVGSTVVLCTNLFCYS